MTLSSRAKTAAFLVALTGGLAASAPALAQALAQAGPTDTGPVPLFPAEPTAPEARPGAGQPQPSTQPERRVIETDSGTITIERLQSVDPNTTGLLAADEGLGLDMWQGTDRTRIRMLLNGLPTQVTSPQLRSLARRLLTSAAELPAAGNVGGNGAGEDAASLLGLRITRLAQLGYPGDALALYDSANIPREADPSLPRTLVEANLLNGNMAGACDLVKDQESNLEDSYWQQNLVLCQLADDNPDAARFGATLLENDGLDDPLFFALVTRIADGRNLSIPAPEDLTPLHLGLMTLAGEALPATALDNADAGMLRAIAASPGSDIDLRLAAVERAAQAGVVDAELMAEIYKSVPFEAADLDRPISIATENYDSRGRALLFQAASIEAEPETKALIVGTALKLARQNGFYPAAVALYAAQVQQLPIRGDLAQFAGEATRLLFAIGRPQPAQAWLNRLAVPAASDPEAQLEYQRLWALSRLAGDAYRPAREEADRTGWLEAIKLEDQDESGRTRARRAYLAYRLLDVAGREPASERAWAQLAASTPVQLFQKPNPAAVTMMVRATQTGSRAEAIAWMLTALGPVDAALADPDVLVDAIYTLRSLGLEQDAQALALEVALANNL